MRSMTVSMDLLSAYTHKAVGAARTNVGNVLRAMAASPRILAVSQQDDPCSSLCYSGLRGAILYCTMFQPPRELYVNVHIAYAS
jgi:hypothetical protein